MCIFVHLDSCKPPLFRLLSACFRLCQHKVTINFCIKVRIHSYFLHHPWLPSWSKVLMQPIRVCVTQSTFYTWTCFLYVTPVEIVNYLLAWLIAAASRSQISHSCFMSSVLNTAVAVYDQSGNYYTFISSTATWIPSFQRLCEAVSSWSWVLFAGGLRRWF